jgi:hypothetical protein
MKTKKKPTKFLSNWFVGEDTMSSKIQNGVEWMHKVQNFWAT